MMAKERGATRSTLSAYETDLRNFYNFLNNQKVEDVTSSDVQDYLATQGQLSVATLARRLSSLRQFYAYLFKRGAINSTPLSCVKVTHPKLPFPSSLSMAHVEDILKAANAGQGAEGKRL